MSLNFGSVRVFIRNYVSYSFGLILRFFLRFLNLGDVKKDLINSPSQSLGDGNFHDFKVDGFAEELSNFLFWSDDYHHGETECSVFMDSVHEEKTEFSVLKEIHNDLHEDSVKTEIYAESILSKVVECEMHEEGIDKEKKDESVFIESESSKIVVQEDDKENEGEGEGFVSMENNSNVHEFETKSFIVTENGYDLCHDNMSTEEKEEEEEIGGHAMMEIESNVHEDEKKKDGIEIENENEHGMKIDEKEIEGSDFKDGWSKLHEDGNETEYSVFMESVSDIIEDGKKIVETDIEESVSKDDDSNIHDVSKKIGGIETKITGIGNDDDNKTEQETEYSVFVESDTIKTTTSRYEYFSEKDISCFVEEPTTLRFSFREYYTSPDVSTVSQNAYKEFSKLDSEKDIVTEEQDEKEESIHSTDIPLRFESEAFGGTDSSDEDYFIFNENSVTSDSESESSSSSGLIWSNSNKIDDSFSYEFLGSKNGSEILKLMMRDEGIEGLDENQSSFDDKVSKFGVDEVYSENEYIEMEPHMKGLKSFEEHGFEVKDKKEGVKKSEEAKWEEELNGSESDEDDFEWEHEEIVEQLKLELRNSRQGGLATIIEEVEDEEEQELEEKESPRVVEELKPLKIEVKLEYKDQMDQIEKVYKSYAEKMRKLDILNYQTMHALGLLQLKDPLKLISIPKSTISNGIISQNLWPRKSTKITSDPFLKLVHQLHRDLELVYVGQICLSWEILCWLHMKAIELQQYDSQKSHRYNHVAGEFQLFQVLMQRFIENEPFQGGPRIQNYVKNRCVIRNLLHVPAIKDDSKGGEEDPIASGRLQDIIKESMRVFWEFVRTDKDNGNVNVISKQIGSDLKDPAIANLLVDIRIQLQKKDKKLKDIVRTGNCIVKKFQKHHEDQLDHEQLVAQVGLRLISRVVNMSQLRKEQVLWCSEKLNRIKFLSRKIVHVEPSFLPFPC